VSEPVRIRITADDLGWSEEVDDGIALAADAGALSAVSVLATGPSFEHGVKVLRNRRDLSIGLHLDLTDFRAAAPRDAVSTLVDGDGRFRRRSRRLVLALLLGAVRREHVEREIGAQLARLGAAGLRVRHLDGHRHAHIFPGVPAAALAAVRSLSLELAYVRVVPASSPRGVAPHALPMRTALVALSRAFEPIFTASTTARPSALAGLAEGHALERDWIANAASHATSGLTEIVTHPGLETSGAVGRAASHERATDLAALRSPALRELIASGRAVLDRPS